jgi:hypothetical protein
MFVRIKNCSKPFARQRQFDLEFFAVKTLSALLLALRQPLC